MQGIHGRDEFRIVHRCPLKPESVNSDLDVGVCLIIPWKGIPLIKEDGRVPFSVETFSTLSLNDCIIIITRI